jgi:hypothetical protein
LEAFYLHLEDELTLEDEKRKKRDLFKDNMNNG